ncbi:Succinyl-CoA:mesaconate CoA-transferase [Geodia barretti]|uniref:Succinyl-CoA:mesaconate CoA-transferase n=1 Tax=Geodia barretti TaxID=519541 RepID=A0AA35SRJ9_GEOBA|nr:Succinyl-CoA:mesaconate CoA-transferase [Geodia barretti]
MQLESDLLELTDTQGGNGALSDLRVLDFTHYIAGPYATKLLADHGADVLKVERIGDGDGARRIGPFPGDVPHPEKSGMFLHLNTNKRSITLNLKSQQAQSIVKQLVEEVDVVVESFLPVRWRSLDWIMTRFVHQSAASNDFDLQLRADRPISGLQDI